VTPKGQVVSPIRLEPNIWKTAGDASQQVTNHLIVCCEAVRLAILAIAWLLVYHWK